MEDLPLEVVEMIVPYLSPQDLAACCGTSHSWRNIFNQDFFWKYLTNRDTAVYLARTPCLVKPAFISPEVEGSGLDPVCPCRMDYMRENHLLNNWRSGKYTWEKGIPYYSYSWEERIPLYSIHKEDFNKLNLFYQEDFLISLCHTDHPFQAIVVIWDLRGDSGLTNYYVNDPCLILKWAKVRDLFLCGNRLVVVQRTAVLVFQINLLKQFWPLEHIFFWEADETTDFKRATHALRIRWVDSSLNYTSMVGSYLLAIDYHSRCLFNVWDIVKGLKLKEERVSESRECTISRIKPSTTSSLDAIVELSVLDSQYSKVLVYSLLNFTFYPCIFEGVKYCDLHRDKIVLYMKIPYGHWLIANYKTGEHLHRIEEQGCLLFTPFTSLEILNNKLIYISNDCLNQINLSTGEIKQFLEVKAIMNDFLLLNDKLICMPGRYHRSELWEICVSKPLAVHPSVYLHGFAKTNSTSTKMIVQENGCINLIGFW